jgi:hypothetical protein
MFDTLVAVVYILFPLQGTKSRRMVMLIPLLLGCATVFLTMGVQIAALVYMLQYLFGILAGSESHAFSKLQTTYVISTVMMTLFIGHMAQAGIWAVLFMRLGEFGDFKTAFYHSLVNFAALGYGDIVMSERWRLLGAIEASTGVLMFGVSAGVMLAVTSRILTQDVRFRDRLDAIKLKDRQH